MIAGGIGAIATLTHKIEFPAGTLLVNWRAPACASAWAAAPPVDGSRHQHRRPRLRLRAARQPEIERRAQEVINHCWGLGDANPILAPSTTSAPAASQRLPRAGQRRRPRRAGFDLRKVPLEESGLAPKEIWCNESQERYVLAIAPEA